MFVWLRMFVTAEPVFDSSPALFQPSASVLSVPGTPSGNPGAAGAFVRPPTGVSTTRSEHHVRSYHQSEALATRQELGPNMLPLPPEGQLFINTATWGNYFHEKERDQAISSVRPRCPSRVPCHTRALLLSSTVHPNDAPVLTTPLVVAAACFTVSWARQGACHPSQGLPCVRWRTRDAAGSPAPNSDTVAPRHYTARREPQILEPEGRRRRQGPVAAHYVVARDVGWVPTQVRGVDATT